MRLFVGLALPRAVRSRLALLSGGLPGARWVAPENLHVTLRFIGEVEPAQVHDIDDCLSAIGAPAFAARLVGVGCFERGRWVHALWVGVDGGASIRHLFEKVESAVVRAGLPPEGRKFMPHVTLARLKKTPARHVGGFLEANGAFTAEPFAVEHFTLFESRLGREGAHYEAVADHPLAAS